MRMTISPVCPAIGKVTGTTIVEGAAAGAAAGATGAVATGTGGGGGSVSVVRIGAGSSGVRRTSCAARLAAAGAGAVLAGGI